MKILGVNNSHDSSCALVIDGKIIAYIEEERITRYKHGISLQEKFIKAGTPNSFFPYYSLTYCLDAANLSIDDLDYIVTLNYDKCLKDRLPIKDSNKIVNIPPPSHHFSHAIAAFLGSQFDSAAVLVADYNGSVTFNKNKMNLKKLKSEPFSTSLNVLGENHYTTAEIIKSPLISYYDYEGESGYFFSNRDIDKYSTVFKNNYPLEGLGFYGLGSMYATISTILGFYSKISGMDESGKLMGLAPYGEKNDKYSKFVDVNNHNIDFTGFSNFISNFIVNGELIKKESGAKIQQEDKDIAYFTQKELEKAMLSLARYMHKTTESNNLCLCGGVALNSVANQIIVNGSGFKNVFILPNCNDAGIALGNAFWASTTFGKSKVAPIKNCYFGKRYNETEIINAVKDLVYQKLEKKEIEKNTVKALCENKTVAWFQNGSEGGPRALGNRSILANPSPKWMRDYLNINIKFRETFRPYAASVLEEECSSWFDIPQSPYMLRVANAKLSKAEKIPAVVHVDGTTRVQSVSKEQNLLYYDLIHCFFKSTNIPMILNTSFNIRSMPIVETPADAIAAFLITEIDYLVVHNYWIKRPEEEKLELFCVPNWELKLKQVFSNSKTLEFLMSISNSLGLPFEDFKCFIEKLLPKFKGTSLEKIVKDFNLTKKIDNILLKRLYLFLVREHLVFRKDFLNLTL